VRKGIGYIQGFSRPQGAEGVDQHVKQNIDKANAYSLLSLNLLLIKK
jgi:hypothetical protein